MHAHFIVPQSYRSLDWTNWRVLANRPQTIAVVDGDTTVLASIETAMGSACYTVLLLDSSAHAYTDIRRLHPSLVVVCIRLDYPESIQLLTMLRMDSETGSIPIATIAVDSDDGCDDCGDVASSEPPMTVWVN